MGGLLKRKKQAGLTLLAGFLLATGGAAQAPAAFPIVGKDLEPLRGEFNRDAGRVRLLLLLDPT